MSAQLLHLLAGVFAPPGQRGSTDTPPAGRGRVIETGANAALLPTTAGDDRPTFFRPVATGHVRARSRKLAG